MHSVESDVVSELKRVAEQIRGFQERAGFSDAALVREYSGLGSTKTYKRILEGDVSELNVERQLENYGAVLELTKLKRDAKEEEIYQDLRHVRQAFLATSEAYNEKGNDRLIILEGQTGSGKTETINVLEKRFGNAFIRVEAHGGWKLGNNPLSIMCGDLLMVAKLKEFGTGQAGKRDTAEAAVKETIPVSFAARKQKLFEALCERKRIVGIDEGQEMGPFCLNLLKSMINQTPTIFVLAVIPTIFRRLESRSYDDAIQLTGNRLYERIRIKSPEPDEISKFLERRQVKFADEQTEAGCVAKLAELAPMHANWKFINRFARKARGVKGGVDAEQFVEVVRALEKARKGS